MCYLPLNTFLLKPAQRLMHYKLILESKTNSVNLYWFPVHMVVIWYMAGGCLPMVGSLQNLDEVYVLVSSAHKATRIDITCTVLKVT